MTFQTLAGDHQRLGTRQRVITNRFLSRASAKVNASGLVTRSHHSVRPRSTGKIASPRPLPA
eukprot:3894414-Rhodomonas_salina.1